MENKRIQVTELDFDQIKTNLKNYLKGQDQFSDYDFEGSGLSVLLDVLAYNTHYNALYANMAINEAFLDSASKRNSVVSHAKLLGYLPSSAKSSQATVNLIVRNVSGNPATLTLPVNSEFATSIDGKSYTFYNRNAMTAGRGTLNEYTFSNVVLTEGVLLRNKYVAASGTKFIIPNTGCDLSTLSVRVQENANSALYEKFTEAPEFSLIKSTDAVYFVKEIEDELYEVYFGDGVLGKQIYPGNVVNLNYLVSSKEAANNATIFTFSGNLGGNSTVVTVSKSQGGSDIESIDSIKLHAPRNFSAQNRAVTAEDYKTLLPQLYPNIDSVNVWGGDENIPPEYGKVYICIKPKSGEFLTTSTKEAIKNTILRPKGLVSITPEIVDPDYIYLSLYSSVYYNPIKTERDAETIKALIRETISNYDTTELRQFGTRFRFSKLTSLIDDVDPAVTSNITNVRMTKKLTPYINNSTTYTVKFNNPIYNEYVPEEAVVSSGFYVFGVDQLVYMDDDGLGNLRLWNLGSDGTKHFVLPGITVGTVDYDNGIIYMSDNFMITGLAGADTQLSIYVVPDSHDVVSVRDQLVLINSAKVQIEMIVDTVATGQYSGGSNYTFSSSHNYDV